MANQSFEWVDVQTDASRQILALSKYGYTPQTALADIVDNSIAAGATIVRVNIAHQFDDSLKVFISDNGSGMDPETLKLAMSPGAPAAIQQSQLSRFGQGLKTASLQVSDPGFSVVTRDKKGRISGASMLVDDQKPGQGTLRFRFMTAGQINKTYLNYLDEAAGESGSGTVVIWESANLKAADQYKSDKGGYEKTLARIGKRLTSHLSMVFHRWLEGTAQGSTAKVEMFFQDELISPWNPFDEEFLEPGLVEPIPPMSVILPDGREIGFQLKAHVIKQDLSKADNDKARRNTRYQGLYLYRIDRIINQPGDWLELEGLAQRAPLNGLRFALEIDPALDDFLQLDVKKSSVFLPDAIASQIEPIVDWYRRMEEKRASRKSKDANNARMSTNDVLSEAAAAAIRTTENRLGTTPSERLGKTTILVSNSTGRHELRVPEAPANLGSDLSIHLVGPEKTEGMLWDTVQGSDMRPQVLLNRDHDFYQKVMVAARDDERTWSGFLWFLWSFSVAELDTHGSDYRRQFVEMRRHISQTLNMLTEELDIYSVGEDSD